MDRKILVVENDPALLEALKELLGKTGYEVDGICEVEAAQALLSHVSYALVIADLSLTELGFAGLEVLSSLWDRARRPHTIVFSRSDRPALRGAVRHWGADIYLNNPTSLNVIVDSAIQVLKENQCRRHY